MAELQLQGLRRTYPNGVTAVDGIDLTVAEGEFMVLVGPSGCGKSTTLRMIAGLEDMSAGRMLIGGVDVTDTPPAERGVAMVFQSYALYPHMTVAENMGFALKIAGRSTRDIDAAVRRAAESLQLEALLDRKPRALSGGQRQRVAIGRAIVREPKVFLFDEPLSNLDAALRGQTRVEIAKLHRELGATTIYVTHDQVEAMTLADQVVVLRDGAIEQVGSPLALYDKPANRFVAQFIGTPQMNVVDRAELPPASVAAPGAAFVGIRPEDLRLTPPGQGQIAAQVELVEALGAETLVYLHTPRGAQIVLRQNSRTTLVAGDNVGVDVELGHLHWFDESGKLIAAAH